MREPDRPGPFGPQTPPPEPGAHRPPQPPPVGAVLPGYGPPVMLPPTVLQGRPPVPSGYRDREEDVTVGAHRAHWSMVPFRVLGVTLSFVALTGGPVLTVFGYAWVAALTVAVLFGSFSYLLLVWWYGGFGLREDHLVVHSGLVVRSSREIPLSRLQAVDVVRPLLGQVFGLAELHIELAGGDDSAVRLRYLRHGTAERMRAAVLAHAAGLPGRSPEAPERPFYRLPFLLLLGALTFRIPVLSAVLGLVVLATAGVMFREPGVLGGLVPLALGLLRSFWGPLARCTDYYASLSSDGLRLRHGMFQRRMQTVPPGRVQAVRVVEPLLWRALGVARVEATVAGYAGARQADSTTLLPVAPRRRAYALVNELFPQSEVAYVPMVPVREGARSLVGVDDRLFVTVSGVFCQVTEIVPMERVQSLQLVAGPWARFTGRATVGVGVPPGPVRARARRGEAAQARRLLEEMVVLGRRARVPAAGTERWETRATLTRPEGPGEA